MKKSGASLSYPHGLSGRLFAALRRDGAITSSHGDIDKDRLAALMPAILDGGHVLRNVGPKYTVELYQFITKAVPDWETRLKKNNHQPVAPPEPKPKSPSNNEKPPYLMPPTKQERESNRYETAYPPEKLVEDAFLKLLEGKHIETIALSVAAIAKVMLDANHAK